MKKKPRVRYTIRWSSRLRAWALRRGSHILRTTEPYKGFPPQKRELVKWAASLANTRLDAGIHSQLVIFTRKGRIEFERTYGADPRRTKG